jgi:predicted metal-dependent hydrolase
MLFRTRLPEQESLPLQGLPLNCLVTRSRRKTLALHVRHDKVEVRAPLHITTAEIVDFIQKHQHWLKRKLSEKQQRAAEVLLLKDGATIFYKGRSLKLVLQKANQPGIIIGDDQMLIQGPDVSQEGAARILKHWLQQQAKAWLPPRTRALADYLGAGHKLKDVVFRKTRSKWGHCTAGGRIQYNWLIMLAPDAVIDYMISHEVCHLLHMNHSPAFWQAVASVCPDYTRYTGWLKRNEHRLWF